MEDDVTTAAGDPETTSDDQPAGTETPSGEPQPGPDDGEGEGDEHGEPQRDPAWDNLAKKFANIQDPKEREDAIAKAYWEKTNYAARIRRENETLKKQVARIESEVKAKPKEPATPPPPPQELKELDGQLKGLYDEDQALFADGNTILTELTAVDAEIAKCEARIEDAKESTDEQKLLRNEAKLAGLQATKEAKITRYRSLQRDRLRISGDYQRLGKERLWLEQNLTDRQTRQARAQQEQEEFETDFPEQVDRLIESAASALKVPESYLQDLMAEVNDGLLVDLWRLGEADLEEVDLPSLVQARVEKFAKLRNVVGRKAFADRSREKLRVTTPPARPSGAPTPPAKPVTAASMVLGDQSPKMAKARNYLVSKGY